jgi:hypothetical protein
MHHRRPERFEPRRDLSSRGRATGSDANTVAALRRAIMLVMPHYRREFEPVVHRFLKNRVTWRRELGLRFKLSDDLKGVYLGFGNDLAVPNGDDSWTLPMPGRFVVDRTGIIGAADVDPDYQYRPEPEKTVGDVKALG